MKARIMVLYFKHMMVLKGDAEYTLHFNETDALSASQRGYVGRSWRCSRRGMRPGPSCRVAVQTYRSEGRSGRRCPLIGRRAESFQRALGCGAAKSLPDSAGVTPSIEGCNPAAGNRPR